MNFPFILFVFYAFLFFVFLLRLELGAKLLLVCVHTKGNQVFVRFLLRFLMNINYFSFVIHSFLLTLHQSEVTDKS